MDYLFEIHSGAALLNCPFGIVGRDGYARYSVMYVMAYKLFCLILIGI